MYQEAPTVDLLLAASRELSRRVGSLSFQAPVTHVYDPLTYARAPHEEYLRRYGSAPKRVLFWGMNPGPWGMAQTGVPFGEIDAVRGWMGVTGAVTQPGHPHPRRPIEGFACRRSEVSGRRLWGLMRERFGAAERFFADHFVANYCPLVFMEESGRNRTPDKLPPAERGPLFALCDDHARTVIELLRPKWIVGVGKFAEGRLRSIVDGLPSEAGGNVTVCGILHPSPANPQANRDWGAVVTGELERLGIW